MPSFGLGLGVDKPALAKSVEVPLPSPENLRITEEDNNRVTESGDSRVVEPSA